MSGSRLSLKYTLTLNPLWERVILKASEGNTGGLKSWPEARHGGRKRLKMYWWEAEITPGVCHRIKRMLRVGEMRVVCPVRWRKICWCSFIREKRNKKRSERRAAWCSSCYSEQLNCYFVCFCVRVSASMFGIRMMMMWPQAISLSIPASLNNWAIVTSPKINRQTCSRMRTENQHSSARQLFFTSLIVRCVKYFL